MLARGAVAGVLATAGLGVTIWTGALAPAGADPVPPVDPTIPVPAPVDPAAPPPADAAAPPPAAPAAPPADPGAPPAPPAAQQTLFGAFGQAVQANPFATIKNLIGDSPQPAMVLGSGQLPPEMDTTYLQPAQNPLSMADQLKPQNFRMPAADQASPYALSPNDNPSPFARVNAFKGVHAITHSSLGRMPGADLGQPLPGTAPPPGTNIPAGLEQFYVDPAAAPAPAPAGMPPGAQPQPGDPAATAPPPAAPPAPGAPVPVDPLLFGTGAN